MLYRNCEVSSRISAFLSESRQLHRSVTLRNFERGPHLLRTFGLLCAICEGESGETAFPFPSSEMIRKLENPRGHLPGLGQECKYISSVRLILEIARSDNSATPSEGHHKPPLQTILYVFVYSRCPWLGALNPLLSVQQF